MVNYSGESTIIRSFYKYSCSLNKNQLIVKVVLFAHLGIELVFVSFSAQVGRQMLSKFCKVESYICK